MHGSQEIRGKSKMGIALEERQDMSLLRPEGEGGGAGGLIGPQKSGGLDKAKLWIAAAAPMATKGVRL